MALCLRTERRGARYLDAVSEGENGGREGEGLWDVVAMQEWPTSLVVCW